jgi:hypothetical protein
MILFDEAEQSYSVMRKSALKDAHNNLLTLINSINEVPGLFLIYATTPDFYNDNKYGIKIYGALSSRIGQPPDTPPRALENVWNLDVFDFNLEIYQQVAAKVLEIYVVSQHDSIDNLPTTAEIKQFVAELHGNHSPLSETRFWRIMMASLIRKLENSNKSESESPEEIYQDRIKQLKED